MPEGLSGTRAITIVFFFLLAHGIMTDLQKERSDHITRNICEFDQVHCEIQPVT